MSAWADSCGPGPLTSLTLPERTQLQHYLLCCTTQQHGVHGCRGHARRSLLIVIVIVVVPANPMATIP